MATGSQTVSGVGGDLNSQMRQFINNLGGPAATSDGLAELWMAINVALANFTPPSGYDIAIGPATATAATLDRAAASESVTIAVTSGTLYLAALYLPINTVVNNVNFISGTTASTGVTHNWGVLASAARKVLGVSADNTSVDMVASTVQTYALTTPVTVASSGLYYVGQMIATATTQPTMIGNTGAAATVNAIAPISAGASNTSATTPPAVAATLTAITASASTLYGYTT